MIMQIKIFTYIFIIFFLSCKEQEDNFNRIEITKFGNKDVKSFVIDNSGLIFEINTKSNKVAYFKRQLTNIELERVYDNITKLDSLDIDKNFMGADYEFYFIRVFKNEKEMFTFQEFYNYKSSPTKNDSLFSDLTKVIEATRKDSVLVNFSKYQNVSIMIDNESK